MTLLEELEAKAEKDVREDGMNYYELKKRATPGPWEADTDDCVITKSGVRFAMIGTPVKGDNCGDANAALIAHCVNNFDKALEALKIIARNVDAGAVHINWCSDFAKQKIAELETVEEA